MINFSEAKWRQYKADFCRANRCTDQQFHDAYVQFMEGKPDLAAYQRFARKWRIRIISDRNIPYQTQVVLCVNISAMKVMAKTEVEARAAIEEILGGGGGLKQ